MAAWAIFTGFGPLSCLPLGSGRSKNLSVNRLLLQVLEGFAVLREVLPGVAMDLECHGLVDLSREL